MSRIDGLLAMFTVGFVMVSVWVTLFGSFGEKVGFGVACAIGLLLLSAIRGERWL